MANKMWLIHVNFFKLSLRAHCDKYIYCAGHFICQTWTCLCSLVHFWTNQLIHRPHRYKYIHNIYVCIDTQIYKVEANLSQYNTVIGVFRFSSIKQYIKVNIKMVLTSICSGFCSSSTAVWHKQDLVSFPAYWQTLKAFLATRWRQLLKKSTCLKFPDFNNQTNDDQYEDNSQSTQDRTCQHCYSVRLSYKRDR